MARAQIDWSRASVRHATLTAKLTGEPQKAWARGMAERFRDFAGRG